MRDLSNCLNGLFVLLCLPLYLLILLAGVIGFVLQQLAPHWLPSWAQSIPSNAFLGVALTMLVWYVIVQVMSCFGC